MAKKLYYQNQYLQTFATELIEQKQDKSGAWYVLLRETAFYPEGGGQPCDTGTLNGVKVVNVVEIDDEIRHYIDGPLEDEQIEGQIDWERRFDHMQQHTAQHIVSAAFDNEFGFKTVSFHLGKEESTIDLDIAGVNEQHVQRAEELANQIVLENLPIELRWVTPEEASAFPLRKALSVEENIRLVIIPDYDYNGCGGTHPASTAEAGMIKIVGIEKEKKKTRISFVAGNRAYLHFDKKQKVLEKLAPLLNAPQESMESAVSKLLQAKAQLEKELSEAKDKLLEYEARELITKADRNGKPLTALFTGRSIQELQKLGRAIVTEREDTVSILVSETDGKLQIVCAKGKQAPGNMKELLAGILPLINGKGGGSELFAQGGGQASISPERLLEDALAALQM
ncbi:alanyl-tRNA editing protein [Bacillus sp. FJAT-27225]|uniref:alanyl-tRNA editing protein n=1 Tax=Bacillus sp. FJAT-27225 TaxID=1743144 RepID=UPI00080C2569|nr:DHHA1 domain-containing protein [Bacillus sp. FJAT-27225]OCA90615.1 alanyl-tRNA editing protein [Bacillus sp. FJAT-27225]